MKKLFVLLALVMGAMSVNAQHLGSEYRLKKVIPVAGRQGIAVDKDYYYVSDTKVLYKYDKEGNMLMKNDQPFQHPEIANHFGDIDVYNGEIYCGVEKFEYGRGYNIAVSVYDAETLKWKRDLPWCPESGQVEVSGLAVDRDKNMVWMSDWVDSRYVYCYSLETGKYYTKMQCRPTPYWCQGIFIADGKMLFTSDDGESLYQIPDNIYIADITEVPYTGLKEGVEPVRDTPYWCQGIFIADGKMLFTSDDGESLYQIPDNIYIADITEVPYTGLKEGVEPVRDTPFSVKLDKSGKVVTRKGSIAAGAKAGKVELFREMSDFRRAGEIEGLSIDPVNDDLVVLNNRGTQIILGMSQGPFTEEGYKGEIHELYIYEKIK